MTLEYAKITGTNTILFELWKYSGPYELKRRYRDTTHGGQNGGYAVPLRAAPLNFSPTGVIQESDYDDLYAMVGEEVTLDVHNKSTTYTVRIKNIEPLEGIKGTSTSTAGTVETTYLKRNVLLELIRES